MFFRRDWADGAGPAVEAASPLFAASPPVVGPSVGAAWDAGAEDVGGAAVDAGLLNSEGPVPELVAAPEVGGAEVPPPRLGNDDDPDPDPPPRAGNRDEPDAVVVAPPPLVALVAGVDGLPQLKVVLPPVEVPVFVPVLDPAPAKRPLDGAAETAGAAMFPPKVKDGGPDAVGCEEAGCAADEVPRLNPPRGLLAGVEDGVVLPRPLKSPGF